MLQRYDSELTFPPVKKIGITTDHPERREKELLGTISPVKISIVKAWTEVNAREIESMLHTVLDNSRIDGEYFWDGNETLIDAVSAFIKRYHPEAKEISIDNAPDVKAATDSANKSRSQRIFQEVVPRLESLGLNYEVNKNGRAVRIKKGEYTLGIGSRTGGRYTLTIWSKVKSTDEALEDFPGSQELSANSTEDSNRKARIPMSSLEEVIGSISKYMSSNHA